MRGAQIQHDTMLRRDYLTCILVPPPFHFLPIGYFQNLSLHSCCVYRIERSKRLFLKGKERCSED